MVREILYLNERLVIPRKAHLCETIFHLAHDSLGHFGTDKSACTECTHNKSRTTKPTGPLHPLPVPDHRGDSVAIDFIGPLPQELGFDGIMTITDRLGADVRLIPCRMNMNAQEVVNLFFDHWYCENGLPGVKLKMSTAYHPQTNGASKRTNKTVDQVLRYFVDWHQTGWVTAFFTSTSGVHHA